MDRFETEVRRGMSIQPGERERTRFDMPSTADHDPGQGPSFGTTLRRHWRVLFACIGAMAVLAIAYSVVRTPNYAAETRLAVGGLNATTPAALTGFSAAAQQLAETYSRSASGDAVVQDVAKALKTTPDEVRPHLSAAPIPQTPVFLLTATTKSEATSVDMSRLASEALVRQANRASDATPGRLLARYEAAEAQRQRLAREVSNLAQGVGSGSLAEARGDLIAAEARADSLKRAYFNSEEGGAVPLQIIQQAATANSDRFSKLQLLLFIGIVCGFIIGSALAIFLESSRATRLEESSLGRWELARRTRAQRARARRARD
jgi:uncharacterized protein involved in exopolysaccharide biosynthesis